MKSQIITLPSITIVGLKQRLYQSPTSVSLPDQICAVVEKYWQEGVMKQISEKSNPGVTYCGYYEYESDYRGNYSYFIGEAVSSSQEYVLEGELSRIIIPEQKYICFTTESGQMPDVCIEAWQQIWKMESTDKLSGDRSYLCDFELYDERAQDPQNAALDIYIGIKS